MANVKCMTDEELREALYLAVPQEEGGEQKDAFLFRLVAEVDEYRMLLGMALVGLRVAVNRYDADDQVLLNVEAGLREMCLDPDKMYDDATRPE